MPAGRLQAPLGSWTPAGQFCAGNRTGFVKMSLPPDFRISGPLGPISSTNFCKSALWPAVGARLSLTAVQRPLSREGRRSLHLPSTSIIFASKTSLPPTTTTGTLSPYLSCMVGSASTSTSVSLIPAPSADRISSSTISQRWQASLRNKVTSSAPAAADNGPGAAPTRFLPFVSPTWKAEPKAAQPTVSTEPLISMELAEQTFS